MLPNRGIYCNIPGHRASKGTGLLSSPFDVMIGIVMSIKLLSLLVCLCSTAPCAFCGDQVTATKITEITLSRSGNRDGTGFQDVLTLRSDGTANYAGAKNVERVGSYSGKIPLHGFAPSFPLLAQMYEGLRGQPPSTGKPSEELTAIISTITRDGKTEEINDLCPGLDRNLWAFEMAVRGVASDIQWKKGDRLDAGTVQPQRSRLIDEANPPKVDLMAWGEEKGGVKTGLGFEENTKDGKHVVEIGRPIKLVVKLRNMGKSVVEGSYSEGTYVDQLPKVEDGEGKPVVVLPPSIRAVFRRQINYSLKPDEELTISSPEIAFVSTVHGNVTIPTVLAKPGKYKIGFEGTGKVEVEITPRAP